MDPLTPIHANDHRVELAVGAVVKPPEAGVETATGEWPVLAPPRFAVAHSDACAALIVESLERGVELSEQPFRSIPVEAIRDVAVRRVVVLGDRERGIAVAHACRAAVLIPVSAPVGVARPRQNVVRGR